MKAIQFQATTGRYVLGSLLGKVAPAVLWSGLSCTQMVDSDEPALPGDDWVKTKTRYGGICGTDLKTIHLGISTYYSPLASERFILGHENVGTIVEVGPAVVDWQPGERVVVEPTLWCIPRGFTELCEFCAKGEINRCIRTTEGTISPGLHTGACSETGGSWSAHFVAHVSQLYAIPDNVTDENAVLVEPFACGVHAALQRFPKDEETVLIVGAGTIGLCTLAALRGLGSNARLIILARYDFQAEAAKKLGASEVISMDRHTDYYAAIGELTHAQVKRPILGRRIMVGGADTTFECVGTKLSVGDALRMTRSGGRVVISGAPGVLKGLDWTPLFYQELIVSGAYIFDHNEWYLGQRRSSYEIAIELMAGGNVDIGWLVTHRFALKAFKEALALLDKREQHAAIKAVFQFE
jgi:threonine dehydrogenase-like Zn-dependent dehydrogenase